MSHAIVGRWGKSLGIRFPAEVAKAAGFGEGERVEITSSKDAIVIRKLTAELTAESMFAEESPETWRALYRDAYDWGGNVGQQRAEE